MNIHTRGFHCAIYADGRRIDSEKIIGRGLDGYIVLDEPSTVMKVPKLLAFQYLDGSMKMLEENELHKKDLDTEKEVYQRLQGILGIANCLHTSSNGLTLQYYQKGSLEDYISRNQPATWNQRKEWILQIVNFVAACHQRNVLLFDIALRNFLLADDWSIRAIDFANSTLLPEGETVILAASDGYTEKLDILHVANVIYSICRWEKFQLDCVTETEWPATNSMPSTRGLPLESVIVKMWNSCYRNLLEVHDDISCLETKPCSQNVHTDDSPSLVF